ncbi:protein POLR1D-like isoform X2 [Cephus cinctus]|uniref:Protein POLR1D-like isoform X2 n=1 Tax=Cephus cinctus TaxID=211228 RepID=A0AAJ7BH58_CEPCN|nr:protein POLR1D-like isoform X2 [Cephus cinctus]
MRDSYRNERGSPFTISNLGTMDEETLNRLAAEALLEEAKVGARRAEIMGPSGWIKPKETINKRFLHSTLRNVVLSNKHRTSKKDKTHECKTQRDTNDKK